MRISRDKDARRPFIIRTVVAMIVIYLAAAAAATYLYAQEYADRAADDVERYMENIMEDLKCCRTVSKESAEYREGLNVAQASAVMRYYRFMNQAAPQNISQDMEIALYRLIKDEAGNVTGFEEAMPQTPVLTEAPYSKNGRIIVFADVFNDRQMEQLEKIIRKNQLNPYIENARGYVEGRLFYPTEIAIGWDGKKETVIKTDYQDSSRKLMTVNLQDIRIIGPGERIIGGHIDEKTDRGTLREESEKGLRDDVERGFIDSQLSGYEHFNNEMTSFYHKTLASGNYMLRGYFRGKPYTYAFAHLTEFYLILAMIIILAGVLLASSHNKVITMRLATEEGRRKLMDSMAHEMKTPLGIIRNYGEVLLEEEDESKRQRFTQNIIDETDRLNNAVVSMLDLSRMEEGTYPMELSSVSVKDLAEREAERIGIILQKKNIQFAMNAEETGRILADEKLVAGIISNFLSNGITYTKPGSRMSLTVAGTEKGVYIAVRNEGRNIPESEMEKLWNKFYRGEAAAESGSGIGLALVRNACLMHGGEYGCRNEADGVTFWVKLSSMEKHMKKTEMFTGPVLGVTSDGYDLHGFGLIAAGYVIQGLLTSPVFALAAQKLFMYLFMDNNEIFDIFSASTCVMILAGTGMMLAGAVVLCKRHVSSRALPLLAVLAVMIAVIISVFSIGNTLPRPLWADVMLLAAGTVEFICLQVFAVMMFVKCMKIARVSGTSLEFRLSVQHLVIYIVMYTAVMVYCYVALAYYPLIWFAWVPPLLYAAYSWLRTYRRFNGRVKI